MKSTDTATIKRVAGLLAKLRELQVQADQLTDEIQSILGGGPSIGETLKVIEQAWKRTWETRYRSEYLMHYKTENPAIKRLLRVATVEEIQARMVGYITDNDAFLVKARHPFGLFASAFNRYARGSGKADIPAHDWTCEHRDATGMPMHASAQECEHFEILPCYAEARAELQERRGAPWATGS